jgi:hypothetical protein
MNPIKYLKGKFQRKPKAILLDNTYRIVPAFEWRGETYYMHEDPLNVATGRGLTAMLYMEELFMRCSVDYLNWHVQACERVVSDPKKIDVTKLIMLNRNLKERIGFLAALPQHVFKLASVVYFTKTESPFRYDHKVNQEKVKAWEREEGMYDFFCQGHLKTLMPFLALPESNSANYGEVIERIQQKHMQDLQSVFFKNHSISDL